MTAVFSCLVLMVAEPKLPITNCLHKQYPAYEKYLGKAYEVHKGYRMYKLPSNTKIAFVQLTDDKAKEGTVNSITLVFKKGASITYKEALDILGVDYSHSSTVNVVPNDQAIRIILGLKAGKLQTGSVVTDSSGIKNPKGGDFSVIWYTEHDSYKEGAVLEVSL